MIFDGKLYLNLEKQVQKNKEDIEYIINEEGALNQFGLRVVGQVETIGDMPTIQAYKQSNPNWEYGDAFMVGASTAEATVVDVDNATLLVLTRANTIYPNDFWMNLGKFPKPGPTGPVGPKGEQGIQGVKGIGVQSGSTNPTAAAPATTTYINATTGDVFVYSGQQWDKIGNIKGATGSVGATGPQGKTGPIGPSGPTGPQGQRGIGVNILGTLTSTSQLPDPTTVGKDSAYIIPADGVNHLWVIEGTDNLVWTDFGTAGLGEKGDKGADGVGINTMTDLDLTYGNTTVDYNTTDGMTINGKARFTYDGGTTKDVTMDIDVPIVAGEGIIIGKQATGQKVEIKVEDGKYLPTWAPTDGQLYVYGVNQEGTQIHEVYTNNIIPWSIVRRGSQGQSEFGDPTDPTHAVNLRYANNHYVPIHNTGNSYTVYGTVQSEGQIVQVNLEFDQAPTTGTIVQRGEGGVVRVGTPVGLSDATNKAYVDAIKRYSHHITIGTSVSNGAVCFTVENYDSNPIDTQEALIALFDGNIGASDWLSATGHLGGNMVYAVYGGTSMFVRMYNFTSEQDVEEDIVNYGTLAVTDKVL